VCKAVQTVLQPLNGVDVYPHQYQGVISILHDRAWAIRGQGVLDRRVFLDELLKDIRDKQEQIWGQWISLAQSLPAGEPGPWRAIHKHCRFGCTEQLENPGTPTLWEASCAHDPQQTAPENCVESLGEV